MVATPPPPPPSFITAMQQYMWAGPGYDEFSPGLGRACTSEIGQGKHTLRNNNKVMIDSQMLPRLPHANSSMHAFPGGV